MDKTAFHNRPIARGLIGVIVGLMFGFVIEVLCVRHGPPKGVDIRLPVVGPALGAGALAVLGILFGGIRLRGVIKHAIVGTLIGISVGVLAGAVAFPVIMTLLDPHGGGELRFKIYAMYRGIGILLGVPTGAAFGLIAGIIRGALNEKHPPPTT